MKFRFEKYDEQVEKAKELFQEWQIRYNIFEKIVSREIMLQVKKIKEEFKKENYQQAFENIGALSGTLEQAHTHMLDLEKVYGELWSIIRDYLELEEK